MSTVNQVKPSDLAFRLTDIVARHTKSCGIWQKEPLTLGQLHEIGEEVFTYFDSLGQELLKQESAVAQKAKA